MAEESGRPQSYDYSTRKGIRPISWEDFHGLCKSLAKAAAAYAPEIILPVGRGGYYPGALIAHLLRVEVYPIRLTRRENDLVVRERPRWLVQPPRAVRGRRVLVVDEICGQGETLKIVTRKVTALGSAEVRSAVLYAHTWGAGIPDYIGLVSDALILNPWDREILLGDEFQMNPEYVQALAAQGVAPGPVLLIQAPEFQLDKGGQ